MSQNGNALYLELLKRMLTRFHFEPEVSFIQIRPGSKKRSLAKKLDKISRKLNLALVEIAPETDWHLREIGQDWPAEAETMVGLKRLDQLQQAIETVTAENIPGDLVEAGIWRGGATIFMTAALECMDSTGRKVFAADSFQGLPEPDPNFPIDEGDVHSTISFLGVARSQVEKNFIKYNVPMDRVTFVEGWFEDTLAHIPTQHISILRLDGDMYSSTIHALEALYDRVSPGGYVIVDDYSLVGAQAATHDFLKVRGEEVQIINIDGTGAYWRVSDR